jgi:hypothetical protein
MNWEKMKEDLDAAVRQQSVAVLDEAIGKLLDMRAKLLTGEVHLPPSYQTARDGPGTGGPYP